MTEHDTLFSLLRQANPVPDPEALVETSVLTDRETTSERNQTVSTTQTTIDFEQRRTPPRRQRSLALAGAALLVVIAAGVVALLRPAVDTAAPSQVATSFFEAINENDPDAWWALHSPDVIVFGESVTDQSVRQGHQDYFDWRTTVESRFEDVSCTETGSLDADTGGAAVRCEYVWRGAIQDRFGVALTGYMLMAVADGEIVNLSIDSPDFTPMRDVPVRYLSEHRPDQFADLCGNGPGAFNGGAECASLYMENLDGMVEMWEAENG